MPQGTIKTAGRLKDDKGDELAHINKGPRPRKPLIFELIAG